MLLVIHKKHKKMLCTRRSPDLCNALCPLQLSGIFNYTTWPSLNLHWTNLPWTHTVQLAALASSLAHCAAWVLPLYSGDCVHSCPMKSQRQCTLLGLPGAFLPGVIGISLCLLKCSIDTATQPASLRPTDGMWQFCSIKHEVLAIPQVW